MAQHDDLHPPYVLGPQVSATRTPTVQPVSGTFWQATQPISHSNLSNQAGTWNYRSGTLTSAGSVTGNGRCLGIHIFATGASSFNISGGAVINLPAGADLVIEPQGTITAPVINWLSGAIEILIHGVN